MSTRKVLKGESVTLDLRTALSLRRLGGGVIPPADMVAALVLIGERHKPEIRGAVDEVLLQSAADEQAVESNAILDMTKRLSHVEH